MQRGFTYYIAMHVAQQADLSAGTVFKQTTVEWTHQTLKVISPIGFCSRLLLPFC